ncbi:unnamed protein product [Aphanomyces euteiches]
MEKKQAPSPSPSIKLQDGTSTIDIHDDKRCKYKFGKCMNPRTYKINGTLHSLCTTHRLRQNAHQLKSDRKRRQLKSLPLAPGPAGGNFYSMEIRETLCSINANLLKLTQLIMQHEELSRAESCKVLLSLNQPKDEEMRGKSPRTSSIHSENLSACSALVPSFKPREKSTSFLPPLASYVRPYIYEKHSFAPSS